MSITPPMLRRQAEASKNKGYAGRKAEVSLASRLKGKLQVASGAIASCKGDVVKGSFLIENKTSMGASFQVKREHLQKIYKEALDTGKTPALSFQFVTPIGVSQRDERWIALPESWFIENDIFE